MTPCGDDEKGRPSSEGGEKQNRTAAQPKRRGEPVEPPLDESSLDHVVRDCPL